MAQLKSINPSSGSVVGKVKMATKSDLEIAIAEAKEGYQEWRGLSLKQRARILTRLVRLIQKEKKELSLLITKEMGKPINEAKAEVDGACEEALWLIEKAELILRDVVVEPKLTQRKRREMRQKDIEDGLFHLSRKGETVQVIRYDPVGVVGLIKPWNYPIATVMTSLMPALMAGNSVILKPSEEVPLVSEALAKLIFKAGVSKKVFQVLQGRGQLGAMLVDSEVDMISFTGSSKVGKEIYEKCAKSFKKCVLELGGSSPALVLQDADLDLAVNSILSGRFGNCGQVCSAIKRVYVEKKSADRFIKKLAQKAEGLVVGDPIKKKTMVGPLVSLKQLRKLQDQVTKAVVQGGRIIVGGRRMRSKKYIKGFYHEPTIMIHVTNRNIIMQEEVFGPVLPISVVDNFDKAIEAANDSQYGLSAVVYTNSLKKMDKAIKNLKSGSVSFNQADAWNVKACWTGMKKSGTGVELGKHGIWEYSQIRNILINRQDDNQRSNWFDIQESNELEDN